MHYVWFFVYGLTEDIIVLKILANGEITEDLSEVDVIWLVIEEEGSVSMTGRLPCICSKDNIRLFY